MGEGVALVTGAGGEMGHDVLPRLHAAGVDVVAVDLAPLPSSLRSLCAETVEASVLDRQRMERLIERHAPRQVFHLAAVLSRKAESDPDLAHQVNVEGTLGLFGLCERLAGRTGRNVLFMFPSSIAVYGLPDADAKRRAGAVKEIEWTVPAGVYGCNKLYCELIGTHYNRRASSPDRPGLDFRAIRFPGLISADTLPTGGTTDYASEMIHAAARGVPYECFVSEPTTLPFMTMPDAVEALLELAAAPSAALSSRVYNIRAFSPSAGEFGRAVREHFPAAEISFAPNPDRQAIVDSWPGDVDDGLARADWGFSPRHGLAEAMAEYLVPSLDRRYATEGPARRV